MKDLIINMVPWFINIGYFLALFPQIYLNYKHKSTKGLSELFILGNFVGYLLYFWHAYIFNFPLAYKILLPVTALIAFILILQSFIYSDYSENKFKFKFYLLNFSLIIFLALISIIFPQESGNIAGWISSVIWCLYLVPQVIKIYRKKSVKGFSFLFVLFIGFGGFTELASAIFCNLSAPIYFNSFRGFLFFAIFLVQFLKYKK